MKALWWIVVATWTMSTSRLMAAEQHITTTPSYDEVNFTTAGATKNSYTTFIETLRGKLASGDERHGIPVLRQPSISPSFVLVELTNSANQSITLTLDVTNVNVVAYRARDRSYFFRNALDSATSNLFTDAYPQNLHYNSSYGDLESYAHANREDIDLGIPALNEAISFLSRKSINDQDRARSLMVCSQMVSEPARFRYIEQRVRQSITSSGAYETFHLDAAMLSLQTNWKRLSTAIQESNQGVFSSPVQLQRADHSEFTVTSVTQGVIANLALMLFICKDKSTSQHQYSHPLMIRSVVAADDDDDNTCVEPEPTVRISGRNGLCVDVRDGFYNNGNPIQLWTCKDERVYSIVNQLWTLKRDGTIRSNGKCLTASAYTPGSYVMIYDCPTPVTAATRWQVWDNGTIILPESGLVLTANSGKSGTELTVETNIYASRQGWLAGNSSQVAFETSIVGYMDLCLEANQNNTVWLVECESSKAEQKWAIYPDGTIRPQHNRNMCVTYREGYILALDCSVASESQRWMFRNDGTIVNLNSGMVMDVKDNNPSLHKIIIWTFHGGANQKWLPLL